MTSEPQPNVPGMSSHLHEVLPNGTNLLVKERPTSGVVAVSLAVRAGARDEGPEDEGSRNVLTRAHLLGTPTYPTEDDLRRVLSATGGGIGASTSRELIQISLTVPEAEFDLAMSVLREVVNGALFDGDAIDRDKRLIVQDIQRRLGEPVAVALDTLTTTVWAGHPAGHSTLGTLETVAAQDRDSLLALRDQVMTGSNLTVALVGQVSPRVAFDALAEVAGLLPAGVAIDRPFREAAMVDGAPVIEKFVGQRQSQIYIGVPTAGRLDPDRYALYVMDAVLGSASGRMFAEIRTNRGLAYSAGANMSLLDDAGIFYASAGTSPENVDTVRGLIVTELRRLASERLDDATLQAAIGQLAGRRIMSEETSGAQAGQLAALTALGAYESASQFAVSVRAVTADDILRTAQRYFTGGYWTVIVRPMNDG